MTKKNELGLTACDFLYFWIQAQDDPNDAEVKRANQILLRMRGLQAAGKIGNILKLKRRNIH